MCGIVGALNLTPQAPIERQVLGSMLQAIAHRGPDGYGIYRDRKAGLGSARLSIIDLEGGDQPIGNEDGSLWIVYNGEVFNYIELRSELEALGHRFSTETDTEVIIHLYEERGPRCLELLNGQYAFALWDAVRGTLFLARDRLGIRPIYYTQHEGRLIFGSEIKAILAYPGVPSEIQPDAVEEVFTFWSTLAPRTAFRNIRQLPAGHYLMVSGNRLSEHRYWAPDFTPAKHSGQSEGDLGEELEALLVDAARIRLRADVPVGAYLSGGLDSSLTTAIIRNYTPNRLETFSVAFENPDFDESAYQLRMAEFLGTTHHVVRCGDSDIGEVFPAVVRHAETPILRTAPAPLFLLSRLVNQHKFKVVVTGEGADEVLAGYDIFKEAAIRRFWSRVPDSQMRPLLLRRLYPDIGALSQTSESYLRAFFGRELSDTASPFYSHAIRWNNTRRLKRFLLRSSEGPGGGGAFADAVYLPEEFAGWPPLGRAQYLEMTVFLSNYLLSSQGDRVAMAHSVEGRYPFLDFRVVEFCNRLPPGVKLRGLTDKWLLRRVGCRLLPEEICRRPKRPYRAPIQRSFFHAQTPEYVTELLGQEALRASGLFNPLAVGQLARKAANGAAMSEIEEMALTGILSTQLLYQQFIKEPRVPDLARFEPRKVVERLGE